MGKRYRVAQWGTGDVGRRALAAVIEHPRMDLVALRVFSTDKAGRDAGELCGKPATGVFASLDPEVVIAARPDCVVYLPNQADVTDMCRLLEAGINIVERVPLIVGRNPKNAHYLDTKAAKMGHLLSE